MQVRTSPSQPFSCTASLTSPTTSYDFDIQPVLVMLSIFCRHPSLRRRAIHLMRLQHCWWNQLKFYKACMLARIVELVMEVEERGLSATSLSSAAQYTEAPAAPYLPLSHRIRPELCQFGDPNRVSLEYTHLYSSGPSTPFKIYAPIFPETATSAVVFDDIPSPMQQLRTVKLSPLSEMFVITSVVVKSLANIVQGKARGYARSIQACQEPLQMYDLGHRSAEERAEGGDGPEVGKRRHTGIVHGRAGGSDM